MMLYPYILCVVLLMDMFALCVACLTVFVFGCGYYCVVECLGKSTPPSSKAPNCHRRCCCCLPTPMTIASGGSPMFPLVVHQPAFPSIWPAMQSLRRGLSSNPGVTMGCVCGCS